MNTKQFISYCASGVLAMGLCACGPSRVEEDTAAIRAEVEKQGAAMEKSKQQREARADAAVKAIEERRAKRGY